MVRNCVATLRRHAAWWLFCTAALPAFAVDLTLSPECPTPIDSIKVTATSYVPILEPTVRSAEWNGNVLKIVARGTYFDWSPNPVSSISFSFGPLAVGRYQIEFHVLEQDGVGHETDHFEVSRAFLVSDQPFACTPAKLTLLSPSFQVARTGDPFPERIRVLVTNVRGEPVPFAVVNVARFSSPIEPPVDTSAVLTAGTAVSNDLGIVEFGATAARTSATSVYAAWWTRGNVTLSTYFTLSALESGAALRIVGVVEYYHGALDHYFITDDPVEMALLDAQVFPGWRRTGYAFAAYDAKQIPAGANPVCRFYARPDAGLHGHFFSASPTECSEVQRRFSSSWLKESDNVFGAFLPDPLTGMCLPGHRSVYRLFNNRTDPNHRYTTSQVARDSMVRFRRWIAEGYGSDAVAMCVPY